MAVTNGFSLGPGYVPGTTTPVGAPTMPNPGTAPPWPGAKWVPGQGWQGPDVQPNAQSQAIQSAMLQTGFGQTPKPEDGKAPPPPAAVPPAPDPRDSTYWTQLAKLNFQRTNQLNSLQQSQGYEDIDYAEALRRRLEGAEGDRQGIKEQANREGLFFSGQLGKRQGAYETGLARQNADAQQSYERSSAARASQRDALNSGASLDENELLASAGERYMQRLLDNPPDATPGAGETETGGQVLSAAEKKTNNSAVKALSSRGAIRAEGLGGGEWNVRFADGKLRRIRFVGGKPQQLVNGKWKAF